MKENTEQNDISEKIKVFSSDDEKLKVLGELLSNKSSRDIIRLLIEKEMYTNEIAKKLELRPNLVIHHLQKMGSVGLLEITNKKITRKGEEHKFFRIPDGMIIFPQKPQGSIRNNSIRKVFRDNIKLMAFGTGILSSWFVSRQIYLTDDTLSASGEESITKLFYSNYDIWIPILAVSGFIIFGILLNNKRRVTKTIQNNLE